MTNPDLGILLTNIGSPDQPTEKAVRQYLKKFLSDPRVVEIPKLIWWPILHGIILRVRPKHSALLYQQIWTEKGSPLSVFSETLAKKLSAELNLPVEVGMHYGNPSIETALEKLRGKQLKKILILPLYPQYSGTTTAATFDQASTVLKKWRHLPELQMIHHYSANENYINELCHVIQSHPVQYLLFSFHGIPERYIKKGDPYQEQCHKTAALVANKLNLAPENWSVSFQSRLGRAKWIMPYTNDVLETLPKKGVTHLHVVCPGFAVDCLETLEEIAIRGKEQFLKAGGKSFNYIPALNDTDSHIRMLSKIIQATSVMPASF